MKRDRTFMLFGLTVAERSWRGLGWFLLVYIGAFVVGAVGGWLSWRFSVWMATGREAGLWVYLAEKGLPDHVDRVRLLAAAASLVWLIGYCRLWGRFGFDWGPGAGRKLWRWAVLGVLSLVLIVGLQWALGTVTVRQGRDLWDLPALLLAGLVGGLLLAWIEEAIFRGMVLRMVYTAVGPVMAVVLSSALFAIVHFKSVEWQGDSMPLTAGFVVAWKMLISFALTVELVAFLNYFMVGFVLNLVFLRTGSLVACMGLHAGWILVRNTWGKLVEVDGGALAWLLGDTAIVNGVGSLVMLVLLSAKLYVEIRKNEGRFHLAVS